MLIVAIDFALDWNLSLEKIISLGFKTVLSSGQAKTALDGADVLHRMNAAVLTLFYSKCRQYYFLHCLCLSSRAMVASQFYQVQVCSNIGLVFHYHTNNTTHPPYLKQLVFVRTVYQTS